jgi:hypothetical protein
MVMIVQEPEGVIVACCGLVCSECGMHRKGKCEGCHGERPMFKNCPVKPCVAAKGCATCAGCADFKNLKACRKLNNFISKIFGLIFRTRRIDNLLRIRAIGMDGFRCERAMPGADQ